MPQGVAKKTSTASTPHGGTAPDAAALARREIVRTIKGPVCERLKKLVPALAPVDDVYATVIGSPELLHACLQLLRRYRAAFQDLLVDKDNQSVTADDQPLRCDRTVDDIVGMIVRSGAHAYAERRFSAAVGEEDKVCANLARADTLALMERLRDIVRTKWEGDATSSGPARAASKQPPAEQFYAAIKDLLDFDWQVPLIPLYAEMPPRLISELGRGLTALPNGEAILDLLQIGRRSMEGAQRILPEEHLREMLDTQPLAAEGVAFLGRERYEFLRSAVYEKMGPNFWEMCVDNGRLETLENRSARELEQLSGQLHILSGPAIEAIVERMQFWQMAIFLETAEKTLGEERFRAIFGVPGQPMLIRRFTEKAAMIKPLRPNQAEAEFAEQMPSIFTAYLRDPKGFEKGW